MFSLIDKKDKNTYSSLQPYLIIAGLFFEVAETFTEVRGIFRFNSKGEQVSYISLLF